MTFQLLISVMIGWFSGLKKNSFHFGGLQNPGHLFFKNSKYDYPPFFTEKWFFMINDRA